MKIQWMESSNITKHGYCAETKTLGVEFKNGGVYHYPNVDAADYEALKKADSVGSHFHKQFKERKFKKQ